MTGITSCFMRFNLVPGRTSYLFFIGYKEHLIFSCSLQPRGCMSNASLDKKLWLSQQSFFLNQAVHNSKGRKARQGLAGNSGWNRSAGEDGNEEEGEMSTTDNLSCHAVRISFLAALSWYWDSTLTTHTSWTSNLHCTQRSSVKVRLPQVWGRCQW